MFEKTKQLIKRGVEDVDVELTSKDKLSLINPNTKKVSILDGLGNIVIDKLFPRGTKVVEVNDDYFMVRIWNRNESPTELYHVEDGLIEKFEGNAIVVSTQPLQIAERDYELIIRIYDVETRKTILTANHWIEQCGEFYINGGKYVAYKYNYDRERDSVGEFEIFDKQGQSVLKYSKPGYDEIASVSCQKINEKLYTSLVKASGKVELLISIPYQNEYSRHQSNLVISYPVLGYFEPQDEHFYYHSIGTEHNLPIILTLQSFLNHSATSEYSADQFYGRYFRGHTPTERIMLRAMLISYKKQDKIQYAILSSSAIIIELPNEIKGQEIANILPTGDFHIVSMRYSDLKIVVNSQGVIKATGKEIKHINNRNGDFFVVDKQKIFNPDGDIIIDEKFKSCETHKDDIYIFIYYGKPEVTGKKWNNDIIDKNGQSVIGARCKTVMYQQDGVYEIQYEYDYKKYFDKYLLTPRGIFHYLEKRAYSSTFIIKDLEVWNFREFIFDVNAYPLFLETIYGGHAPRDMGYDIIYDRPKQNKRILRPLDTNQLQNPTLIKNMAWLNNFNLSATQYGKCLRFAEINPDSFQELFPYMQNFIYVPNMKQAEDISILIRHINDRPKEQQELIMKCVDLVYSICGIYSSEPLALKIKGILEIFGYYVLENVYEGMNEKRKRLVQSFDGIENERDIINDMSPQVGQLLYYLFFSESDLLQKEIENPLLPLSDESSTLSMMDLLTAYRLDMQILGELENPKEFLSTIIDLSKAANQEHLTRKLTHAIYHQADPDKALYLREFIQNALDAYVKKTSDDKAVINIQIYKNEQKECVLHLHDRGVGMSLEDVFKYFLIPGTSSKRDSAGQYIGGRGIGLFTAYHGAKEIHVKTGIGDGMAHYFELTPSYIKLPNKEYRVKNVSIRYHSRQEDFKGTIIERVSQEKDAVLEAAKYHRALKTHARFINANDALVNLNGVALNLTMTPLIKFSIPELGKVRMLNSPENAITAGGLFVKDLPNSIVSKFPPIVRYVISKNGLVIDLPKNTALNRERNDFESADNFMLHITPHLIQASIGAYIALFTNNIVSFDELPDDFFNRFAKSFDYLLERNKDVKSDANKINTGEPLEDYSKYNDPQLLTDLMCFLELIPYKKSEHYREVNVSLIKLAKLYNAGEISDTKQLPSQIQTLIHFDEMAKSVTSKFEEKISKMAIDDNTDEKLYKNKKWFLTDYEGANNWKLFSECSKHIIRLLTDKDIKIGYSTNQPDALAHTSSGSNHIFWNPIHAYEKIMRLTNSISKESSSLKDFNNILSKIVDTFSHELTHIGDRPCTGTHNRGFTLRQRDILLRSLRNIDTAKLFKEFSEKYADKLTKEECMNAEKFLQSQLKPKEEPTLYGRPQI